MNYLNYYKQFESRTNEVPTIDLKPGQVIVATEDIYSKDIDFKKTAKTWWGKNISSDSNILKQKGLWYNKGDVIFISKGGYYGYIASNKLSYDGYGINDIPFKIDDFMREFIEISLFTNKAKIINYEDLPQDFKNEFETIAKLTKISNLVGKRGNKVIYYPNYTGHNDNGIVVLEFKYPIEGEEMYYTVKGFDPNTKKRVDEYLIHYDDIMDEVFTVKNNGNEEIIFDKSNPPSYHIF